MLILKLKGGLGNQIFQYALGRNLSLKNNTDLKLDISWFKNLKPTKVTAREYGLKYFNIKEDFATEEEIRKIKRFSRIPLLSKIKNERGRDFDSSVLSLKKNVYLEGYWQSEKYFKDIKNILYKDFSLKDKPTKNFNEFEEKIKNSLDNSVSIHIRHGDYSQNPKENKRHTALPIKYYGNAIKYIKTKIQNPVFFVFSDDIKWCKENFKNLENVYFVDKNIPDYEELILMSKCKNNIIANSSFSWWGAWLNQKANKIVIAPQKWFGNPDIKYNMDDRIPEEWIKI